MVHLRARFAVCQRMNPKAERMYAPRTRDAITQVRPGVGVVLRDARGWVLLEKRADSGTWGLPGGSIEPGESIAEAATREVQEETGLSISDLRLIGVYSDPADRTVTYPDNVVQLIDILLEATIVGGKLTCSPESEELRFFDPSCLPNDLVPPARVPLRDAVGQKKGIIG